MSNHVSEGDAARSRLVLLFAALFLIGIPVIAILVFLALAPERTTPANDSAAVIEGTPYDGSTVVDPPRELQDFALTAHTGDPMSLSDLQGRLALIYFGYTHCPDYCPATLLNFQRVHELLGDQADEVAFLFISVDPQRDTPRAIADYLESRGLSDIVTGLAGEEGTLAQVAPDYGLYYANQPGAELQPGYPVDHSTATYLVDREGRLVRFYTFGTEADVIAEDVQELLA